VVFGLIAGIVFSLMCFRAERATLRNEFERGASVTVAKISDSFDEYADVASLVHGTCRRRPRFNASAFENNPEAYTEEYNEWSKDFRKDFRELYEYVHASGLQFKAMQFDPNITNLERPVAESEAGAYYSEHYPHVNYTGVRGFNGQATSLEPRWRNQSFYFPIHYMEPIPGNEAAIDLDYHSSESRIRAVKALFDTQKPSLTDRLSLVKQAGQVSRCSSGDDVLNGDPGPSFGVVLMHPGVRLSGDTDETWPRDFSSIVLCIPDLMKRSAVHNNRKVSVYIHDIPTATETDPVFMGGARLSGRVNGTEDGSIESGNDFKFSLLDEIPLNKLNCASDMSCYQKTIGIANRKWTVTVLDEESHVVSRMVVVTVVGLLVFGGSICLAVWVANNDRRNRTYAALKSKAAAERNALVLENANKAAQTERELNDFLAHEVRNPLSAAMAATQFLRTELDRRSKSTKGIFDDSFADLNKETGRSADSKGGVASLSKTLRDCSGKSLASLTKSVKSSISSPRLIQAREDVRVVDHALHFINDLLRNMLDMNRAESKKLKIQTSQADLLEDILEPVAGMLHRGREGQGQEDDKVKIEVDCPKNVIIETDVLRLKQVILNLGRNSVKFIEKGFIRLRAEVVEYDDESSIGDYHSHDEDCDLEAGYSRRAGTKTVRIYVEDSGSGIPEEKQEQLFAKYQESLDLLSQGTGIGLHLCKNLVDLLGGEISLDSTYDSGVPGFRGARFIVDLQSSPLNVPSVLACVPNEDETAKNNDSVVAWALTSDEESIDNSEPRTEGDKNALPELPKGIKVLFIDDDRVLRKLFSRTIRTVAPDWIIREAANGETALVLAKEEKFDLIFCDMYMASVEKQLLGTETVAELRANGCQSRICGLSANDKEAEFLDAGTDTFLFKPIPCQAKALVRTLHRVLNGEHQIQIS